MQQADVLNGVETLGLLEIADAKKRGVFWFNQRIPHVLMNIAEHSQDFDVALIVQCKESFYGFSQPYLCIH